MSEDQKRQQWLSFKEIVDIRKWQQIQDSFAEATGICLRTVDPQGNNITTPSNKPRSCQGLTNNHSITNKLCGNCLPTFLGGKGVVDKNLNFSCLPGVHIFVSPLRINGGDVWGYILAGPVILVMRRQKEEYRQVAEELNLELDDVWNALLEMKVLSFQAAQSFVGLIKDVGNYNLKLAYQDAMQKRELTTNFELPKLGNLMEVLLEVAFQLSGADIGSIMFYDKEKDELTIKASKGLSEEIVKNTRVRLGNGISGIAAKDGKSILINDDTQDNRIRPYLNRPNLSSSMIVPLKADKEIFGVMNLGAFRSSTARFNAENLIAMNRLANVASVAIA
ncbi:MAG: PocR ligand-binding domain-containing protein [Candidatus Omnitrophota bacterium]|nr:PocR ligand-binding domain-containing protein [Candidatus Omnitrophota bacterium]